MAETEEPTVSVRDLISVYESKTTASIRSPNIRPRSKSLGNILGANVVVRLNEVITLGDVENELDKFKVSLSEYNVYSKEKHVKLQNQVFNILTSIYNIKSDDDLTKRLTAVTLSLVSSLNQKLPSNTSSAERTISKYISYDEFRKQNGKNEVESSDDLQASEQQSELSNFELTVPENISDKPAVSVKNLKQRFQSKSIQYFKSESKGLPMNISQKEELSSQQKEYRTEYVVTFDKIPVNKDTMSVTPSHSETDSYDTSTDDVFQQESEKESNLTVLNLRLLYEKKMEENARGLSLIFNDNTSENHSFRYKVNTPYLERQPKENHYKNTLNHNHGDNEIDENFAPSLTESNYETAYSSLNGYESGSEKDSESNSSASSLESTGSVREVYSIEITPVEN